MNPLDSLELQAFCRKLNEEMPALTESTAKVKWSYVRGMPKNFMEDCAVPVDNRFLNDNLSIVEEIAHRDPSHPIPKWFREYQIKHFAKHGILKADGFFVRDRFFGRMFPREIYYGAGANYHNMGIASVIGNTKVFGSVLESGAGGTNQGNGGFEISKVDTLGVIGHYYDQIALDIVTPSGNYRMAAYDDNAGAPNNLYAETASLAQASGYTFKSLTEFALTTQQVYLALQSDSGGAPLFRYKTGGVSGDVRYKPFSYGAFPNPAGSGFTLDTYKWVMKIGHS